MKVDYVLVVKWLYTVNNGHHHVQVKLTRLMLQVLMNEFFSYKTFNDFLRNSNYNWWKYLVSLLGLCTWQQQQSTNHIFV